jgi:hypothetical protein
LISGTAALCVLVVRLYAMASEGSSVALLFADVLVGAVLGMFVIRAHPLGAL